MKRLYALLALCLCAATLQAKKYICAVSGPVSTYITEFETFEECKKYCDVCEETAKSTKVVSELDPY